MWSHGQRLLPAVPDGGAGVLTAGIGFVAGVAPAVTCGGIDASADAYHEALGVEHHLNRDGGNVLFHIVFEH